jgi:cobalt-zinc-cadmium efflux system protein
LGDHHDHDQHHDHGHGHDDHGHGHGHHHHGAPATGHERAFAIGVTLNAGFVLAEIAVGLYAHSLALLADAGHNLGDVLGLVLAWGAVWLGRRRPSARRTYGFKRSSILASLINAGVLLVGVGGIAVEAIRRLIEPGSIDAGPVAAVAALGIVINGATALLFMRGREKDLNIMGAFQHMAADALVSAGVVVAALAIAATGWQWLDPVVGLVIAAVIIIGTWKLLRASLDLALDAVPQAVDPKAVQAYLSSLPGVAEVHDLHIWAMSTTETALTVHLVRPTGGLDDALIAEACRTLSERFGIGHATFQLEEGDAHHPCGLAPAHIV